MYFFVLCHIQNKFFYENNLSGIFSFFKFDHFVFKFNYTNYYFIFHAIDYKEKVNFVGIRGFFEGALFTTVPRTAQRKRVMPKNTRGTQVDVKRS